MCNIVVFALVFAYFWLFELAGFEELRNACGQVDVKCCKMVMVMMNGN